MHAKSVHMHNVMSHGSVCDGMLPNSPVLRCFALIMHLGSGYTQKGPRKVAELAFGRDLVSNTFYGNQLRKHQKHDVFRQRG